MKRLLYCALLGALICPAALSAQGESQHDERRRAREEKTRQYCEYMDSLIRSHVYVFMPQSMQVQPAGRPHQIRNTGFRLDVRENYIDLYLPVITGITPPYRTSILNQTLIDVGEYRAEQSDDGQQWTITFSSRITGAGTYRFTMTVTTCTGDAYLEILTDRNARFGYSGFLNRTY